MKEQNNNIDKFFKSKLEQASGTAHDWNTPPLSVLDKALDQIPVQQKPRRFPFVWLSFLGVGILAVSIFTFSNRSTEETLEASQIVQQIEPKVTPEKTVPAEVVTAPIQRPDANQKSKKQTTIKQAATQAKLIQHTQNQNVKTEELTFNPVTAPRPSGLKSTTAGRSTTSIATVKSTSIPPLDKATNNFVKLNFLNHYVTNNLETEPLLPHPNFTLENLDSGNSKDNTLAFQLHAGINLSTIRMKNVGDPDFSLTEYNNYYIGNFTSLSASKAISSKLALSADVGYVTTRNSSKLTQEHTFNQALISEVGNNETLYSPELAIASPVTSTQNQTDFRFQDVSIDHGSKMEQESHIDITTHFLRLGLNANLNLIQKGAFTANGKIGLGSLIPIQANQDVTTEIYYDDAMIMQSPQEAIALKSAMRKHHLTTSIGINLAYQANDRTSLLFTTQYERGLTSLRVESGASAIKTYQDILSIGLGGQYRF